MSDSLISVIIPHYNTPDLLMRCLASIPVREDLQVIVIDDCSPDAARYLEDYPALSRPYLEFYTTPQGGSVGRARNLGLDHARGEWICFVDADDYVEEGYFPESMPADCDMVLRNWRVFGGGIAPEEHLDSMRIEGQHPVSDFFGRHGDMDLLHTVWSKFFRRSIVEKHHLRFDPVIRYGEDVVFDLRYFAHCLSIRVLDGPCYRYHRAADWGTKYCVSLTETHYYLDAVWLYYRQLPFESRTLVSSLLKYGYISTRYSQLPRTRLRFLLHPSVYHLYRIMSRRSGFFFFLSYVRGLLVNLF